MSQPAVITTMSAQAPPGYTMSAVPPDARTIPPTRPCFRARLATAVLQTILGVTAMICHVAVIFLRYPSDHNTYSYGIYSSDEGDNLDKSDIKPWVVGIAVFMVITSCFGFFSRKSQALISFYMALSILAASAALIGIFVAADSVHRTIALRRELQRGLNTDLYNGYNPYGECRLDDHPPHSSDIVSLLDERPYYACLEAHLDAVNSHLPCWIIILICFILEFIIAIVAASSTCPGLNCCRKTRPQQQAMVYMPQAPTQVVLQHLTFQQMSQPQMSPQLIVPADPPPPYTIGPPPPYTSLIHEPTDNRPINVTSAVPVHVCPPAALTAPSASPFADGDAFPPPVVTGRRIPAPPLPPDQPQSDPAYLEPINGGSQQGDVPTYLTTDVGGPPQSESSYLTPNVERPPHHSSYVVSIDRSRPQNGNAYAEPEAVRPIRGERNEAFQYDYADPMEEEHQTHRSGQNADD